METLKTITKGSVITISTVKTVICIVPSTVNQKKESMKCWKHSPHGLLRPTQQKQKLDCTIYELTCQIISNTPLSVRCRQSTLQRVTSVIRLPWHFPDGGWKMSETKGWLNGFHPLLRVWCFLIDRLIPWRNRMCQGRRLMEQAEARIPQTPRLNLNLPVCCGAAHLQLVLSIFCFASLVTLGLGWKVTSTSDLSLWCF